MAQITVLDRNMVNMIAAGEVIERPAGAVRELGSLACRLSPCELHAA